MKRINSNRPSPIVDAASRAPEEREVNAWRFYSRLVDRPRVLVLIALMVLASLTEGVGLLMLIPIAQNAVGTDASPAGGVAPSWLGDLPLGTALAAFIALVALRALIQMAISMRNSRLLLAATEQLRTETQRALLGAKWRWLARQDSATLGNLIVQQAERIAAHLGTMLGLVAGGITALVLTITASALAPVFTAAVIATGLVVALPISLLRGRTQSEGTIFLAASEALHRLVNNGVSHLRAARIANADNWLSASFDRAAAGVRASEMRFEARVARARALLQLLAALALALLVYAAIGWQALPVAVLVPVVAIFARLLPIALTAQQARRSWDFTRPAIIDLERLVREADAHVEARGADVQAPRLGSGIAAEQVVLRAAEREKPILGPISFLLAPGSVTSLSGPSGSGKSTLADILCGLIAPDEGRILIDGVALDGPQRTAWRARVSYVEQQPFFWPATVRENLTWGRGDLAMGEIESALRDAAADFVFDLPGGLEFPLGDMGRPLSGGERQRLSFARALLKQPDLLIVDEVLASLDPELRARLVATIRELGITTVIISHDEPSGISIDRRIVLERT